MAYHPAVQRDVSRILRYYDRISPRLGDAFWEELLATIEVAAGAPGRFHPVDPGRRRANLKRFPYHFLYRIMPQGIRVLVVRHHERHPSYGKRRM
ncbi:MAG: type II toxin-antitoxin system RelE/ParE family toxin [Verrucomicrobiales bacterium]|nr:type II toxin-antitoxin system RelE/ParE family toxin [Verrucomicrobiales bacterium]